MTGEDAGRRGRRVFEVLRTAVNGFTRRVDDAG
jgi:hypothetical protein